MAFEDELDCGLAPDLGAWRCRPFDLHAGLHLYGRVRVEHREVDLVRGERLDRKLDEPVDGLTVCAVRPTFEEPARRAGQRINSSRNGGGELDVVALVWRTRRPFRTAVQREDDVGRQLGDGRGDFRTQFGSVADVEVGKVPELDVVDPDNRRR